MRAVGRRAGLPRGEHDEAHLEHRARRLGLARPDGEVRLAPDGTEDGGGEAGMATAEYAIGTLAAAAFAGLLLAIMRSGSLQSVLQGLIESALSAG